jgi:hypothetical protein
MIITGWAIGNEISFAPNVVVIPNLGDLLELGSGISSTPDAVIFVGRSSFCILGVPRENSIKAKDC